MYRKWHILKVDARRSTSSPGVDVTVIRSWLGHAHLDMTNHYAQANLETNRKALEQVDPEIFLDMLKHWDSVLKRCKFVPAQRTPAIRQYNSAGPRGPRLAGQVIQRFPHSERITLFVQTRRSCK